MSRPASVCQQWLQLNRSLSSVPPALRPRPNIAPCANLRVPNKNDLPAARLFHTTSPRLAQRKPSPAPSTRMKMRASQPRGTSKPQARINDPDKDGLFQYRLAGYESAAKILKDFDDLAEWQYDKAKKEGFLPSQISFKTYRDVSTKLISTMYTSGPSAQAIRAISIDVDTVSRIGHLMSHFNPLVRDWIFSASAAAGARMPVCLVAARLLKDNALSFHSKWAQEVEKFAEEEFPPAIVLQAKILGQRGMLEEAIALLETKILPFISPRGLNQSPFEDITLSGGVELPHKVYALLHGAYDLKYGSPESRKKADDAIRVAAMEYHDAEALMDCASVAMDENDLDKYEECMSMAATAGIPKACLYLANFYYLTFHGKYATRGERKSGSLASTSPPKSSAATTNSLATSAVDMAGPVVTWISSFFGKSLSRKEYHGLAVDWYYLACKHGETRAAFMLGLIWREDGYELDGRLLLDEARMEGDADFADKLDALKRNWYNKEYEPRLPKRMLDVR
ncbi:hypothetical protein N7492_004392 [Penicillium capsulatum]|uniref:Uncharacterized protein n=1 Tax=Penicillium capsulatum TaxID=69766 RepID=A0A9W9I9S7_9EURO|nr:hypothetical protein N7492_004392 [Penicillium capsulatum]KAJ6136487.1 hypothetical protein N7512_001647 [Penicillium capsulatum]